MKNEEKESIIDEALVEVLQKYGYQHKYDFASVKLGSKTSEPFYTWVHYFTNPAERHFVRQPKHFGEKIKTEVQTDLTVSSVFEFYGKAKTLTVLRQHALKGYLITETKYFIKPLAAEELEKSFVNKRNFTQTTVKRKKLPKSKKRAKIF